MPGTRIVLSDGDEYTVRTVDLMHVGDHDHSFVLQNTLKLPPPKPAETERTVTCDLLLEKRDTVALLDLKNRIQDLLDLAERATGEPGGSWTGTPVSFWVAMLDAEAFVYFDVKRGMLDAKQRDYGPANVMVWTLTLTCLPYARGPQLAGDWSGELTNASPTLYIPAVPGNRPPLAQWEVLDDSTGGKALNAIRQGRRSLLGMEAGDFVAVAPFVAESPGTSHTDATAMNGANTPYLACSADWQAVGIATVAAGGLNAVRAALRAHFKVDASFIDAPFGLSGVPTPGTGTVPPNTYTFILTELDGSGNESVGSDPLTVTLSATGEIVLNWTVAGSPADHRLYYTAPGGGIGIGGSSTAWSYVATGSGAGSFTFSSTGGYTTATPPTSSSSALLPPELRLWVGLNVPEPRWYLAGEPFVPQISGDVWEFGYGGTPRVPPLPRQEGGTDRGYKVLVEARLPGSGGTAHVSVDYVEIWPHDEGSCYAAEPDMDRTTPVRWLIDGRRDGVPSCLQTDFATTPADVGSVPVTGTCELGTGGNLVIFSFEGADGDADSQNLRARVRPHLTSRWLDVTGVIA